MRKTIDFTEEEIQLIEDYQKRNDIKSFSKTVKDIINSSGESIKSDSNENDNNFAILADAILKIDDKINILIGSIAPRHAQ